MQADGTEGSTETQPGGEEEATGEVSYCSDGLLLREVEQALRVKRNFYAIRPCAEYPGFREVFFRLLKENR